MTEATEQFSGVGKTAIFVAMMRRHESERPDGLFRDPFAQAMLDALAGDPALPEVAEVNRRHGFPEYFAVRTRFFDDAVLAALHGGTRQVVALGAGMDGRTLRLDCPPGTRWFELDMPEMAVVKDAFIARSGLPATCERHSVGADLTADWPTALREAGFDPGQPTFWLVEGLLMYLSDSEGDAVLGDVTALSAPGSRLTVEHLQPMMLRDAGKPLRDRIESLGTKWRSARGDLQPWLAGHGWRARVYAGTDPRISHGRAVRRLPASWLAGGRLFQ